MPCLVRNVRSSDGPIDKQLEHAFGVLAKAWLQVSHQRLPLGSDWRSFAAAIDNADERVPVLDRKSPPFKDLVTKAPRGQIGWKRSEIFNGLRHIEVLLGALEILKGKNANPGRCAPTQGSANSREKWRDRVADLEGKIDSRRFILEAYGGVDYKNNCKAALDLKALGALRQLRARRHRLSRRVRPTDCLVACRSKAKPPEWKSGKTIREICDARHGGPFEVSAKIRDEWCTDDYCVIWVDEICTASG